VWQGEEGCVKAARAYEFRGSGDVKFVTEILLTNCRASVSARTSEKFGSKKPRKAAACEDPSSTYYLIKLLMLSFIRSSLSVPFSIPPPSLPTSYVYFFETFMNSPGFMGRTKVLS